MKNTTWRDFVKVAQVYRGRSHLGNGFVQEEDVNASSYDDALNYFKEREFESRDITGVPKPRPARRLTGNESHEDAYRFHEDIVPEIRKREVGSDKLSARDAYALSGLRDITVRYLPESLWNELTNRRIGFAVRGIPFIRRESISVKPGAKNALPHELKHIVYSRGMRSTKDSMARLQREYGFSNNKALDGIYEDWPEPSRSAMLEEEMRTTNTELQFKVYSDLKKRLGRNPNSNEYFKYIDDMDDKDVIKLRNEPLNGYDEKSRGLFRSIFCIPPAGADGKERADQIRRLLNSVTMSRPKSTGAPVKNIRA